MDVVEVVDERVGVAAVTAGEPVTMTGQFDRLLWHHVVAPARPERFGVAVRGHRLSGLSLLRIDHGGMPVRVRARPPVGHLAFCFPERAGVALRRGGRRLRLEGERAGFVAMPDQESVTEWDPSSRLLVVRVELSGLHVLAERMLAGRDEPLGRLVYPPALDVAAAATLRHQARLLEDLLACGDDRPVNRVVTTMVREQLLTALLLAGDNSWRDRLRHGTPRGGTAPSPARVAAELMTAHLGEPLTIDGLAREVGVSPRALHAGFRREFGCSPKQYLTLRRLESAHDDLRATSGMRVLDIAHRWGFSHPGRFAAAYQRHYGFHPAQTGAAEGATGAAPTYGAPGYDVSDGVALG